MSSRMRRTGFRFLRNKQYSARDLSECPAFFQDGLRRPTSIGVQPGKQIPNSCSCRTRKRAIWVSAGSSPTSSRKIVPPSASSKRPKRRWVDLHEHACQGDDRSIGRVGFHEFLSHVTRARFLPDISLQKRSI